LIEQFHRVHVVGIIALDGAVSSIMTNILGAIAKTVHFGTLIVKIVHFSGLCKNGPLFSK
jgi:hypothetical protein